MRHRLFAVGTALRALAVTGLLLGAGAVGAQQPKQQQAADRKVDAEAERVLRAMTGYLGGLQAFSAQYDVDNEVISTDGQKLQFSASGTIEVQRPGRLHATRTGGFADVELFFDGKAVTLLGKKKNVFKQLRGPTTIDQAIETLRSELDVDLAGADLLYADLYEGLLTDVRSGTNLGPGVVNGVLCDHLAFRAEKVDWQIWVQRGDKPLPLKYVITSKWVTGAPQYTIRLHHWNTQPQLDPQRFVFRAPAGARELETVATNELGELSEESKP